MIKLNDNVLQVIHSYVCNKKPIQHKRLLICYYLRLIRQNIFYRILNKYEKKFILMISYIILCNFIKIK